MADKEAKKAATKGTAKKDDAKKAKSKVVKKKTKVKRTVTKGKASIFSTFNNTIITLADEEGRVLSWSSAGTVGFKGAKKSTPFAASRAAEDAVSKSAKYGLQEVSVVIEGPGPGKQMALKGLRQAGLRITALVDGTKLPHNGCRAPKKRRV